MWKLHSTHAMTSVQLQVAVVVGRILWQQSLSAQIPQHAVGAVRPIVSLSGCKTGPSASRHKQHKTVIVWRTATCRSSSIVNN